MEKGLLNWKMEPYSISYVQSREGKFDNGKLEGRKCRITFADGLIQYNFVLIIK